MAMTSLFGQFCCGVWGLENWRCSVVNIWDTEYDKEEVTSLVLVFGFI